MKEWLRGGLTVIDQALFAGTNFAGSVLLARWLSPSSFGVFASVYAIYLLVAALHTAAISEPMLVYGANKYEGQRQRYVALTIQWHAIAIGAVGSCVIVVALAIDGSQLATFRATLIALGSMLPILLLYWLTRRACYITREPQLAVFGGCVYLGASVTGIVGARLFGWLSAPAAIVILGVASLSASMVLLLKLQVTWRAASSELSLQNVVREHMRYARWSCPSALVGWCAHNVFYVALPLLASVEAGGALRALTNLIMPSLNGMVALSGLLLPTLATQLREGGSRLVRCTCERWVFALTLVMLAQCVTLAVGGGAIVEHVYGGQYAETSVALMVLAAVPIAYVPVTVYDDALRATGQMSAVFRSYAVSASLAVTAGTMLMGCFGLTGAAVALLIATGTSGALLASAYYRTAATYDQ